MKLHRAFNNTGFSKFLNRPVGRVFRIAAGTVFLAYGFLHRTDLLGILSIGWGILPFTAGSFDVCYISAVLGGPLTGTKLRNDYPS
jgi:hypothetical protein